MNTSVTQLKLKFLEFKFFKFLIKINIVFTKIYFIFFNLSLKKLKKSMTLTIKNWKKNWSKVKTP